MPAFTWTLSIGQLVVGLLTGLILHSLYRHQKEAENVRASIVELSKGVTVLTITLKDFNRRLERLEDRQ